MWSDAVITNAGKALLAAWVSGGTLNIVSAAAGSGTVSAAALMAQTALVSEKQNMSIISMESVTGGIRLKLQLTSEGVTTSYTLNQMGIKASLSGGSATLLALFQDSSGIIIPTYASMPDFVFTFYATLQMSNSGSLSVTLDTSAVISLSTMNEAIEAHSSAADAHAALFADKLDKDGDGSNLTEVFVQAATRANILTGENHATIFGKIKKFFADLGTAAFKSYGSASGNVPEIGSALGTTDNVPVVTNTSGQLKPHASGALGTAAFKNTGTANGVAELGSDGKVLSSQLPSYVDDVLEYASLSVFPTTGESGKIYVALNTNLAYRWGGSAYVEISPGVALGEASETAYRGDRGKTAYDHSQASGNPHGTTAAQVGADPAGTASSAITAHNTNLLHKQAYGVTQSGDYSNAEGYGTVAGYTGSVSKSSDTSIGAFTHAEGNGSKASGNTAHAEGKGTVASGEFTHAEGGYTTAAGGSSHAEGNHTNSNGINSHAEGLYTQAKGSCSHAGGAYTTADTYASRVFGQYNKVLTGGQTYSYSGTADAFVIGNGTSASALANAFRVTFDGKTYGLSAFNSTGADYAEFFEWLDGNPNSEDRTGYFVTLDGDKIRKATAADDYKLGVISAQPSVVGDSFNDAWNGMYLRDEWGRILYHDVTVAAVLDSDGNVIDPERVDYVPQLNPEWDSSQPYVPREQRLEWATVGMMGKLLVRDDGSCIVNGFCSPNDDGIATASPSGYRVMKRISDSIVQILLK